MGWIPWCSVGLVIVAHTEFCVLLGALQSGKSIKIRDL